MFTDKLKELASARAKLTALEQSISAERNLELAELPARYGFADTASFVAAVEAATGGNRPRRGRKPKATAKPEGKRRKRALITDETRAEVKKLVGEGKSGAEIAKIVGISLPSVQNVKKALGLVKKRK